MGVLLLLNQHRHCASWRRRSGPKLAVRFGHPLKPKPTASRGTMGNLAGAADHDADAADAANTHSVSHTSPREHEAHNLDNSNANLPEGFDDPQHCKFGTDADAGADAAGAACVVGSSSSADVLGAALAAAGAEPRKRKSQPFRTPKRR